MHRKTIQAATAKTKQTALVLFGNWHPPVRLKRQSKKRRKISKTNDHGTDDAAYTKHQNCFVYWGEGEKKSWKTAHVLDVTDMGYNIQFGNSGPARKKDQKKFTDNYSKQKDWMFVPFAMVKAGHLSIKKTSKHPVAYQPAPAKNIDGASESEGEHDYNDGDGNNRYINKPVREEFDKLLKKTKLSNKKNVVVEMDGKIISASFEQKPNSTRKKKRMGKGKGNVHQ